METLEKGKVPHDFDWILSSASPRERSTIAEATACFSSRHISASAFLILGKIGVVMCKRRPPQIALIGFPYPLKQLLSSQYMET